MLKNISLILLVFLAFSCKKEETNSTETKTENTEISNVQNARILKNGKGEQISVIYFAEGDKVAVKLKFANQQETTFHAKTVTEKGSPVFSDGKRSWEMSEDGTSGFLIDESGNRISYQ